MQEIILKNSKMKLHNYSQGRIQRFSKGGGRGAHYVSHHGWWTKKILGFRWSKKAKITLENKSFWRNISISIFKFSPFLFTMKTCQRNLILVNFLCWQNVHIWRLIKVNYKGSLWFVVVPEKRSSEAKRKFLQITLVKYKLKMPKSM